MIVHKIKKAAITHASLQKVLTGNWTRDLVHPKDESYP